MKTLKQLLEKTEKPEPSAPVEPDSITSYVPKTKDEKRFMDKHVVKKTDDANGNGDDVFRASNIKAYDRTSTRHGYNTKDDQKVYEQKTLTQILGEKKLTSAEMKKREEIAQAMERDNPGMDKSKKMAIATATAKRVAEESEQVNEVSLALAKRARDKAEKHVDWDEDDMRDRPEGHSERQRSKFQRYIDKKEPRAKGDRDWDPPKKNVKEETELDEAARHDQYSTYHAGVKDMLKKLSVAADAHKEAAMSPTDYNKEKGGNLHSGHVYAMKNMHRTLQDMHDNLQQDVEYAQPPKPIKMKEEADLFDCFAEGWREQVKQVYESLDDNHKQVMIEMIEAEDYDTVLEVVQEVMNG